MRVIASAPGKLMLFGEHAVVYGFPCIVTAVSSRITVEVEKVDSGFKIEAPQVKDVRFIEESVRFFKEKFDIKTGLNIKTKSEFSSQYGFGSSSAVTAAVLYGLNKLFSLNLTKRELFNFGYEINLRVQKVGSGFDIAAAIFGKTVYFVRAGKIILPLKINELPLVIGYSGIKADTPKIVQALKLKIEKNKRNFFSIFEEIKNIVEEAKVNLIKKNWTKIGQLMTKNHQLLQDLGVSTKKLDQMCQAATEAGAYGAKLSGAGGGDCMIALVDEKIRERVEKAIEKAGGQVIKVLPHALGVRIEK
ncbi:MAG: mevalonate kinase [Microgenomates group bacterium]